MTASASAIAAFSASTASGARSPRSWSNGGISARPPKTSSSTPSGSSSAVRRRSCALVGAEASGEAENLHLRLVTPACTNTRVASSATSSASIEPPSGSGAFHVSPTAFLSTVPASEPELPVPPRVGDRLRDRPRQRDRRAVALHLQHPLEPHAVTRALPGAGIERELGIRGRVEEIGRGEMLGELLVVDVDARRLRDPQSPLVESRQRSGTRPGTARRPCTRP